MAYIEKERKDYIIIILEGRGCGCRYWMHLDCYYALSSHDGTYLNLIYLLDWVSIDTIVYCISHYLYQIQPWQFQGAYFVSFSLGPSGLKKEKRKKKKLKPWYKTGLMTSFTPVRYMCSTVNQIFIIIILHVTNIQI